MAMRQHSSRFNTTKISILANEWDESLDV